jgi:hypothetical protein
MFLLRRNSSDCGCQGSLFTRGVGSQLMLRSSIGHKSAQLSVVNDRARRLLSRDEQASALNYYVTKYCSGHVTVEELFLELCKILDTKRKVSMNVNYSNV